MQLTKNFIKAPIWETNLDQIYTFLDYCKVVELLINAETRNIKNETFNVGYQNLSIMEIAELVKQVVQKNFHLLKKLM